MASDQSSIPEFSFVILEEGFTAKYYKSGHEGRRQGLSVPFGTESLSPTHRKCVTVGKKTSHRHNAEEKLRALKT